MSLNNSSNKILVISPAWVGDLVMAQALLKQIKKSNPKILIDVLAPKWAPSLLERMPEVNQIHVLPIGRGQLKLRQRWQIGRSFVKEAYQQAIVLPNSWKSGIIPFAAKIPVRTGWLGEQRWGLLNDIRPLDKKAVPLMIERFFNFAAKGQADSFEYPKLQIRHDLLTATLTKFNLETSKPILVLCPGAEYGVAKRWPTRYYAEVARHKIAQGWVVWILGSQKEKPIATEIQSFSDQQCVDLTGRTLLGEAVDLLSLANCVISNDTGLMHIAAALDRPIIAIYGSSSPDFTPPLTAKAKVLSLGLSCSPCFKRVCPLGHLKCLEDLAPKMVLDALEKL